MHVVRRLAAESSGTKPEHVFSVTLHVPDRLRARRQIAEIADGGRDDEKPPSVVGKGRVVEDQREAEVGGAVGENLRQSLDWLPQAKQLLTIKCDVELPLDRKSVV